MSRDGQRRGQEQINSSESIYRIPPYFYIHVLNHNTNVTRVEVGPQTYIRQDHERLVNRYYILR
ncbi:Major vault protein [Holothuria leucospilota]|uniref:Major vault protein n=1 Tax=Holothuria leucospilota TaxID=206669 RepID=A0A9Q0Y9P1_HOLLE|nr:Major vault protein [Holothuria leucospilota]